MKEQDLLNNRDELESISQQMEKLKARKDEIVNKIVAAFFPADKEEGTKTVTEYGIKMELGKTINYSIGKEDAELFFQNHSDIADQCIGWSPRVKAKGYRDNLKVMAKFVTAKPGTNTVSFK